MTPVLEARGLSRPFGHVRALDGADFDIERRRGGRPDRRQRRRQVDTGQGAVGQPGPGLGRGRLRRPARSTLDHRRTASELGIEIVYQDLALAPHLDPVPEHVPRPGDHAPRDRSAGSASWTTRRCGSRPARASPDSAAPCGPDLAGRARCPVASASRSPSPGPSPGPTRWSSSTSRPRRWAWCRPATCWTPSGGCGTAASPMVFIRHSMPHVLEVADRVQVLRLGRRVATYQASRDQRRGAGRRHDRRLDFHDQESAA